MVRRKRNASGEDLGEYGRHYSDRSFMQKVRGMPRGAGRYVLERALTLYVILTDRETPLWARALIIGALGYFIWPFDAIPDTIPVLGYADDMAVMGLVLTQVGRFVTPSMVERVQRLMPEGMRTKPTSAMGTTERKGKGREKTEQKGSTPGGDAADGQH